MEGSLRCGPCALSFPIAGGIPRFADLDQIEKDKKATAEGFGWQWQHFTQTDERYADQFLGWIAPVRPEFFKIRSFSRVVAARAVIRSWQPPGELEMSWAST